MHQNPTNGNAIGKYGKQHTQRIKSETGIKKREREKKNENYACMQFIVITISLPFVFGWNPWIT